MTDQDNTKAAVLKLLKRGHVTQAEAARLAGRSRQIVRFWAKELPDDAREKHIEKLWKRALQR
jgi:hypothetical protein